MKLKQLIQSDISKIFYDDYDFTESIAVHKPRETLVINGRLQGAVMTSQTGITTRLKDVDLILYTNTDLNVSPGAKIRLNDSKEVYSVTQITSNFGVYIYTLNGGNK